VGGSPLRAEDTMRLYSGPLSLFTAKVRIALAEKGLAYERVEVGWSLERRYEPHHPDVVALNPKRQVPVLVDGALAVYDSTVIVEYLEDRHPEPPLFPTDAAGRARCRQLEAAADEILFPHVWTLIDRGFYPGARDEAALAGARAAVARYGDEREKDLADRAWLSGAAFGAADIANFVFLHVAGTLGAPLGPQHERLRGWLARCAARPAVAREVAEMSAFVQRLFAGGAAAGAQGAR
jgi:glutathione S-transferase